MARHATELRLQRDMLAQVLKTLVAQYDQLGFDDEQHREALEEARQALKAVEQYQREARVMNSSVGRFTVSGARAYE
jgi:hypothetical protein